MKILIINGPNLNLLGKREPGIYGAKTFQEYFEELNGRFPNIEIQYFQSNAEGEIIDRLHEFGFAYDGIVLNAGAYSHTSIAIRDAISSIPAPVIELHISNVFAREEFRQRSAIAPVCWGCICGFGLDGYRLAIESFLK